MLLPLLFHVLSLSLVLPVLSSCELDAVVEKRYETGEEARKTEAFHGGLLPPWLPANARDILLYADLDINDVWVKFELDPSEATALASDLHRVDRSSLTGTRLGAPSALNWWHDCLTLDHVEQCDAEVEFYSRDGFSLALDRRHGVGYVWRR
jgi:hypothetical protein